MFEINPNYKINWTTYGTDTPAVSTNNAGTKIPFLPLVDNTTVTDPIGDTVEKSATLEQTSSTQKKPEAQPAPEEPPVTEDPPAQEETAQKMLDNETATFKDIQEFLDVNDKEISPALKAKLATKAAQLIIDTEGLSKDDSVAIDILNKLEEYKSEYEGIIPNDIISDKLLEKLYKKLGVKHGNEKHVKLPSVNSDEVDTPYRFQLRHYPKLILDFLGTTNYEGIVKFKVGWSGEKESQKNDIFHKFGAGLTASTLVGLQGYEANLGGYVEGNVEYVTSNDNERSLGLNVRGEAVYSNGLKIGAPVSEYVNDSTIKPESNEPKKSPYHSKRLSFDFEPYFRTRMPLEKNTYLKISSPIGVNYDEIGEVGWSAAFKTSLELPKYGISLNFWGGLQSPSYQSPMYQYNEIYEQKFSPNAGFGITFNPTELWKNKIDKSRLKKMRNA